MLLGQELKFKNKLCNLKLGTFFSALLGIVAVSKTPCKGKSFIITKYFKAFALTGRMFIIIFYTQGAALG